MPTPPKIIELVAKFERNIESYKNAKYNETQVRREFIDPFFQELGWDVNNEDGYAELYKDVVHEDAIKIGKTTKAPDYSFRIGGQRKFFVEAKKPFINIKDQPEASYQIRRYAWTAKLPVSILTNFEEFAVFDCRIKPNKDDKPGKNRTHYYTYKQYAEKWDEIAGIFSKQSILQGAFDKFVTKGKKRGTQEVDDEFLKEIEHWRELLAHNIALRNQGISQRQLNFSVQKIIDRIIFLRICEDRKIESDEQLRDVAKSKTGVYSELKKIFLKADDRYNSGLFNFHKEKNRTSEVDDFTPGLVIDDKPLKEILANLYYPESPYEFSVFPSDILGQVYERFLGKVIQLKGKSAIIEDKPEVKKAGGVFYTPTYIVDYIIKSTLAELVKNKKPDDVSQLRILDPACGSGSFLIQAYQYMLDWHLAWYIKDEERHLETRAEKERKGKIKKARHTHKKKHIDKLIETREGLQLAFSERLKILKNNIFGVDIDSQAIETTKLSLLLKLLEVQNHQLPTTQRVLPDLDDNIKCGNSLIGTDFYIQDAVCVLGEEKQYKINAFDWEQAFPEVFSVGGFDLVIGNPPYLYSAGKEDALYYSQHFKWAEYQTDFYVYFLEKAFNLCKSKGYFSFIIPDSWLNADNFSKVRTGLVQEAYLREINTFSYFVFKDVSLENTIFVASKEKLKNYKIELRQFLSPNLQKYLNTVTSKEIVKGSVINPFGSKSITELIKKLECGSRPIEKYLLCNRGIHAYRTDGYGKSSFSDGPQTKRDKDEKVYHAKTPIDSSYYLELKGKHVGRYAYKDSGEYVSYGTWLAEPREEKYFLNPKIAIRKVLGKTLLGCFLQDPVVLDQSLYVLISKNNNENELLCTLGILLSKIGAWYLKNKYSIHDILFPWFTKAQLAAFPIPGFPTELAELVKMLTEHNRIEPKTEQEKRLHQQKETLLNSKIDQIVYSLYKLTPDEIALVESFSAEVRV